MTLKTSRLIGRLLQLGVIAVLVLLVSAPVYRFHTSRNSGEQVARAQVTGCWTPSGEIDGKYLREDAPAADFPFIIFNDDGTFLMNTRQSPDAGFAKIDGNWFYESEPWMLLGVMPWGHRNWVMLNFHVEGNPHFYLVNRAGVITLLGFSEQFRKVEEPT